MTAISPQDRSPDQRKRGKRSSKDPPAEDPDPALAEVDVDVEESAVEELVPEQPAPKESRTKDQEFGILLAYLKQSRGFDFSGYKPASLRRRIDKRMQQVGAGSYEDYVDYLEVRPSEFTALFNSILINVTGFFRDLTAWEYLQAEVLPRMLADKGPDDPVRAWSAGAASGEEAYTLAIALLEAMGEEAFRQRVKIYATDVDEDALAAARAASYDAHALANVPPALVAKYFERNSDRFVFRRDLRRSLIFGRHDLLQDPPIPRLDLLVCRNTLMYFNSEAQGRILTRFHFALGEHGYLFLGKAEMLFTHASLFQPVDLKRRVFARSPRVDLRDRLLLTLKNGNEEAANHLARHVRFRESAFDAGPVAQIVVDLNGTLTMINELARSLFSITNRDAGRSVMDLEPMFRLPQLRACIQQALVDRRPAEVMETEWQSLNGETHTLEVRASPLFYNGGTLLGATIAFSDVTAQRRLQEELMRTGEELETSFEELQSTNEELETTNEELQSTVEELETTNEELRSTNEELETLNEEQQSTNEELQAINDELRRRTDDLNEANAFLESILSSLRSAVAVVDRDLQVEVWSRRAEDMWGLRADEVIGKHLLNLEIGLPLEQLRQSIRNCLADWNPCDEMTLSATNRKGKAIQCQVSITPMHNNQHAVTGVILLMLEQQG
jgi:two-component system CheB/CheR fusion protein